MFIVLGILLSYILFVGIFFTNKVMYIRKKTNEEILEKERLLGHYQEELYEKIQKKELTIQSPLGYNIYGEMVDVPGSKRYMILSHGVTQNTLNSIKYMNIFLKRGWNVILYDHRRHGKSGGKTTSYGFYEKHDLKAVVDWVREHAVEDAVIGIHGESMGAATLLMYAGAIEDGADFYIADCPFSDLEEQLTYRLKADFNIPKQLVMPIANTFLRIRDKYSIRDVSPITVIENIENPVLFIHSEPDDFIPLMMTQQLFEKKLGKKQLYVARNGMHAMSYSENREEYEKAIDEFLEEIGFGNE
ncbi:alpha/beta hydrolase [Bacillus sp. THAF10]|uniref:alpha/beta hydrolase n=1 Tax=Bacillus sp. THAF10 TaxID=2587848 RepID=UPI0020A65D6B|nr:alpha/beta hydrolase [Bacillus sp. THAF10]